MGIIKKIASLVGFNKYDFDKSNPLGGGGERVDIMLSDNIRYEKLDMYQKSHFKRYEFACKFIQDGEVCGDFACGTGYGTVMISKKAKNVVGADLDGKVIGAITERYKNNPKVRFIHSNLLHLDFNETFTTIVSFETLEHLKEDDLQTALALYNKWLKPGGRIIISTPYLQERSEAAEKLGFHLTFDIDEKKLTYWLQKAGFKPEVIEYQNYQTHIIKPELDKKDFIICVARKSI